MAVGKYKKFADWDKLDSFYGHKIAAFSVIFDNIMSRTFCSCGKTFSGCLNFCDCGNPVQMQFVSYDMDDNFKIIEEVDKTTGEISFYLEDFFFDKKNPKELMLDNSKTLLLKNKGKEYQVYELDNVNYLYEDEVKKYFLKRIPELEFYEDIKFWYDKSVSLGYKIGASLQNIKNFDETNYPILYNDSKIYQYPYLFTCILNELLDGRFEDNSLVNFFEKNMWLDIKYMDIFNYNVYKSCNNSSGYLFCMIKNSITFLEEKIKEPGLFKGKESLLELIYHYVFNHMLTLTEGLSIINNIDSILKNPKSPKCFSWDWKYFDTWGHKASDPLFKDFFKVEYIDFFEIYLKENISLIDNKVDIIMNFIETIRNMTENKIPFKEENFKIKNYNWNFTCQTMAEFYKLPADKVSLFLDMFEKSPIDALELVENRRKLTPKQLNAIIDKLGK